MKTLYSLPALLLALILSMGCNLPLATNTPAQGWIDAPRDGMQLPLEPYTLVFHGSDQIGVARTEVSVDGMVLDTLDNPDSGQLLVHFNYSWNPMTPGRHVISVRTQNKSSAWGQPATVTVDIAARPTETPTVTPSRVQKPITHTPNPTSTPTRTRRPTHTSTPTASPTLTSTAAPTLQFGIPSLSSPGIFITGPCKPSQVQININVTGRGNVKVMVFFYKLKDANSNQSTQWSAGQSMQPGGGRKYVITLNGETLDSKSGFSQSQVSYQFVAQLANGDQERSQVFTDLTLQVCLVMPG